MFSFRLKQVPIVRGRVATSVTRREQELKSETQEIVWNFLLKNQDRFADQATAEGAPAVVSNLRQEEIAEKIGVPLHRVIEAVGQLSAEARLTVVPQGPGNPNRYVLRRNMAIGQTKIAL